MELPFQNSLLTCFHRAPRFLFPKCDFFTPIVLNTDFENLDVTTGDTSVAEDAHSSGTPDPTPVLYGVRAVRALVLYYILFSYFFIYTCFAMLMDFDFDYSFRYATLVF